MADIKKNWVNQYTKACKEFDHEFIGINLLKVCDHKVKGESNELSQKYRDFDIQSLLEWSNG